VTTGKLTGMLLELDVDEVLVLLGSDEALRAKVMEAAVVLADANLISWATPPL
jgi:hypothetical protein